MKKTKEKEKKDMEKYLAQMIRQECAALSKTVLQAKGPGYAVFAVKVISKRLANFCAEYVEEAEREMSMAEPEPGTANA